MTNAIALAELAAHRAARREDLRLGRRLHHVATTAAVLPLLGCFTSIRGALDAMKGHSGFADAVLADALWANACGLLGGALLIAGYHWLVAQRQELRLEMQIFVSELPSHLRGL